MVLFDQKAQMACLVGDRIQVACIAQLLCEQCCTKSYKINSPATKKNLKTIFNVVCLKKSRSFKRSGYILGSKQNSLKNPLPPIYHFRSISLSLCSCLGSLVSPVHARQKLPSSPGLSRCLSGSDCLLFSFLLCYPLPFALILI